MPNDVQNVAVWLQNRKKRKKTMSKTPKVEVSETQDWDAVTAGRAQEFLFAYGGNAKKPHEVVDVSVSSCSGKVLILTSEQDETILALMSALGLLAGKAIAPVNISGVQNPNKTFCKGTEIFLERIDMDNPNAKEKEVPIEWAELFCEHGRNKLLTKENRDNPKCHPGIHALMDMERRGGYVTMIFK